MKQEITAVPEIAIGYVSRGGGSIWLLGEGLNETINPVLRHRGKVKVELSPHSITEAETS